MEGQRRSEASGETHPADDREKIMSVVQATRWAVCGDGSPIRVKLLEMNSETVDRKRLLLEMRKVRNLNSWARATW